MLPTLTLSSGAQPPRVKKSKEKVKIDSEIDLRIAISRALKETSVTEQSTSQPVNLLAKREKHAVGAVRMRSNIDPARMLLGNGQINGGILA